jgi:hypothetical protein
VLVQNRSSLAASAKLGSQATSLSSLGSQSLASLSTTLSHQKQRTADEHYWDITSLSSKDSSRASELSALGDERRHTDDNYWEGTNEEPSPAPLVVSPPGDSDDKLSSTSQQPMLDERLHRHKKQQYWEGHYEETAAPQQQSPDDSRAQHKRRHEKPYWA